MMKLIAFLSSYLVTWLRLLPCGGVRAIAAENIALRQQLLTLSRNLKRAPRLTFFDKITFVILTSMISLKQLHRISVIIKPATLLKFHKALLNRKYRLLFSNKSGKKRGSKGPEQSVINLILEMKQRNPSCDYRRVAMQISNAFGISIDKDIVRRILGRYYKKT